eukprot:75349_1
MSLQIMLLLLLLFNIALTVPPNFVIIVADDLGWNDVGYHGATNAYTPNIDSLLNEALEFDRFYAYPLCAPTRATLMTGRYTHKLGMQHLIGLTDRMACGIEQSTSTNVFWSQRIKECQGYNNHMIGKWHIGHFKWSETPTLRGFDTFIGFYHGSIDYFDMTSSRDGEIDWNDGTTSRRPLNSEDYTTDVFANRACDILDDISRTQDVTPFSMFLSFNSPHSPIISVQPYKSEADAAETFTDDDRLDFVSMITSLDTKIGEIVNELKTITVNGQTLWSNTWVLFFSDNGPNFASTGSSFPLRGSKRSLFEGGVRVPAFITGGRLPSSLRGESTNEIIHIADCYKTICTLSESDCSDLALDGKDLTPLITDDPNFHGFTDDDTEIILNVDDEDCDGFWNGNRVCGGIIRKFGNDIFKAVIGNYVIGFGSRFQWNQLASQHLQSAPTVNCGSSRPDLSFGSFRQFAVQDCANNNEVCLYNLSDDPCEHNDLSG